MDEGHETLSGEIKASLRAEPEKAPGYRTYIFAWLGIVMLTGITFALSQIKMGAWQIFLALLIAGTQSALTLFYFMHLRRERGRIFRILIPLVLAILIVLLGLTFSDIAFRG